MTLATGNSSPQPGTNDWSDRAVHGAFEHLYRCRKAAGPDSAAPHAKPLLCPRDTALRETAASSGRGGSLLRTVSQPVKPVEHTRAVHWAGVSTNRSANLRRFRARADSRSPLASLFHRPCRAINFLRFSHFRSPREYPLFRRERAFLQMPEPGRHRRVPPASAPRNTARPGRRGGTTVPRSSAVRRNCPVPDKASAADVSRRFRTAQRSSAPGNRRRNLRRPILAPTPARRPSSPVLRREPHRSVLLHLRGPSAQPFVAGERSHSDSEDAAEPIVARTPDAPSVRPYPSTANRPVSSSDIPAYGSPVPASTRRTGMFCTRQARDLP